ncbi:unnamed protein product [Closterium sp. NIES-54]
MLSTFPPSPSLSHLSLDLAGWLMLGSSGAMQPAVEAESAETRGFVERVTHPPCITVNPSCTASIPFSLQLPPPAIQSTPSPSPPHAPSSPPLVSSQPPPTAMQLTDCAQPTPSSLLPILLQDPSPSPPPALLSPSSKPLVSSQPPTTAM